MTQLVSYTSLSSLSYLLCCAITILVITIPHTYDPFYAMSACAASIVLLAISWLIKEVPLYFRRKRHKICAWAYHTFHPIQNQTHHPYYLVLGKKGSGKSTLLCNMGAEPVDYMAFNNKGSIQQTLWKSAHAHFIEKFCNHYTPTKIPLLKRYWRYLHQLIQTRSNSQGIQGVFLILSVKAMLSEENVQSFSSLTDELHAFEQSFPHKPIHIVLTNMDQLPGFFDIFQFQQQASFEAPFGDTINLHKTSINQIQKLLDNVYNKVENTLINCIESKRLQHHYVFDDIHQFRKAFQRLQQSILKTFGDEEHHRLPIASLHLTCDTTTNTEPPMGNHENPSIAEHLNNNVENHFFSKHLVSSTVPETSTRPRRVLKRGAFVCVMLQSLNLLYPLHVPIFSVQPFSLDNNNTLYRFRTLRDTYQHLGQTSTTQHTSHLHTSHTADQSSLMEPVTHSLPNKTQPLPAMLKQVQSTCNKHLLTCLQGIDTLIFESSNATRPTAPEALTFKRTLTPSDTQTIAKHVLSRFGYLSNYSQSQYSKPHPATIQPYPLQSDDFVSVIRMPSMLCTLHASLYPDNTSAFSDCYTLLAPSFHALLTQAQADILIQDILPTDEHFIAYIKKLHYISEHFTEFKAPIQQKQLNIQRALSPLSDALHTKGDISNAKHNTTSLLAIEQTLQHIKKHTETLALDHPKQTIASLGNYLRQYPKGFAMQDEARVLETRILNAWILEAKRILNKHWEEDVFHFHQSHLQAHYPFTSSLTSPDMSTSFNLFFAPSQIMDRYFNAYIHPLSTLSNGASSFQWLSWQDKAIFEHRNVFDILMTHQIIQKTYFQESDQDKARVSGHLHCTHLSSNVQKIILSLDHIEKEIPQDKRTPIPLSWPSSQYVELKAVKHDGSVHTLYQKNHPWSLDEMIKDLVVHAHGNHMLELKTALDDIHATLHFESNGFIAPLAHKIIEKMHIPKYLLS